VVPLQCFYVFYLESLDVQIVQTQKGYCLVTEVSD
jgi:hypothetical protein